LGAGLYKGKVASQRKRGTGQKTPESNEAPRSKQDENHMKKTGAKGGKVKRP